MSQTSWGTAGSGQLQLDTNLKFSYDRNLLRRAREAFIISNFTAKKTSPKYNGDTVKFSRYDNIAANTTALTEGVVPSSVDVSKVNISATLANYGQFTGYTDDLDVYSEDGKVFVKEVTDNLGEASGETQETLLFTTAGGTTNKVTFATDIATGLQAAELGFRNNLGKKYKKMVTGSVNYETRPIKEGYVGFVTPEGALMLEGVPGFVTVEKYGYADGLLPNEVGSYRGVRYCESILVGQKPGSTPVERAIILAEEGLAEVGIRGKGKIEAIVKPLGSAGTADPLNQTGTIGSKFRFASVILKDEWVCEIELETGYAA